MIRLWRGFLNVSNDFISSGKKCIRPSFSANLVAKYALMLCGDFVVRDRKFFRNASPMFARSAFPIYIVIKTPGFVIGIGSMHQSIVSSTGTTKASCPNGVGEFASSYKKSGSRSKTTRSRTKLNDNEKWKNGWSTPSDVISRFHNWSRWQDLNLRPHVPQTCTLPNCATSRCNNGIITTLQSLCKWLDDIFILSTTRLLYICHFADHVVQ